MDAVKVRTKEGAESVTDMSLLIETSECYTDWNHAALTNSIVEETGISLAVAEETATAVKERVQELADKMAWPHVSTTLIREIVEQELLSKGRRYKNRARKYRTLGLSETEITGVIENQGSADNGNLGHNPDAVLFLSAETMVKQYALKHVFPADVVEAHLSGDVSLHDLGAVFKVYCGSHSIEYVKKLGLNLNTVLSKSKPARTASVLVNHLLTFSATIQNQFAGAVGYDAVNIFFAPFFIGEPYKKMKQVAQELFFGFSQSAFSRGGQSLFSDLNFYLTVPAHYANAKAIGPGGKYVKLIQKSDGAFKEFELQEVKKAEASTYKEFEPWVQQFGKAVLEVMAEGDSVGLPFAFPKGNFHLDDASFTEENSWILEELTKTASKNGSPYFIFDRGNTRKISQCCRLQKTFSEDDFKTAEENPDLIRFQALQNVTINLPRVGYRFREALAAGEKIDGLEFTKRELDRLLTLIIKAHKSKKKYIKQLLGLTGSPLELLKNGMDGKGYMDIDKALFLVGLLGLNELVQIVTGKELHEDEEAYQFGMAVIAYISLSVEKRGEEEGMPIVVEESPAEATSKRLAKLDDYYFNGVAAPYIRGNKKTGAIYYTNSIHIREDAKVSFLDRIRKQSRFHPMVTGGSIIHLWVGEDIPDPASIENLLRKVHGTTRAQQITISPEFTLCECCLKRMGGIKNKCESCGNENLRTLTQITRVVGYFSKVQNWVDSKKEELLCREHDYSVSEN